MTIRDDLCAQRAAAGQLDRELDRIEAQLASRNAAHLVGRARTMTKAAAEFISMALSEPLNVRADATIASAAAAGVQL